MATIKQIQFKRSTVAGKRPLPADIAEGELAINIRDATLFTKNQNGEIIDLGFAKGGRIDGDVIHIGNYTQTGNYTTSGDISGKTILASSGVVSAGDVRSDNGVVRVRGRADQNTHVWFEGLEVGPGSNYERAVIYASPQSETSGVLNVRVKNGFNNSGAQVLFRFSGNGDFTTPRDFIGQRGRFSTETISPVFVGDTLFSRDKPTGSGSNATYTIDALANNAPNSVPTADDANINYFRRMRANAPGTIYHELIDNREGKDEISYWTGFSPTQKLFTIASTGDVNVGNSIHVGGQGSNYYSQLGINSISIGDTNTGIVRSGAGVLDVMASGNRIVRFNATESFSIFNRRIYIDGAFPPDNQAQLQINTSHDGNNTGGNGLTLLGYKSTAGEYYHYFRGKGEAAFNMDKGVTVASGGIRVLGDSHYSNSLSVAGVISAPRIDSIGDFSLKNALNRHIRFEYNKTDGTTVADGFIFKDGPENATRRQGVRIISATPNRTGAQTASKEYIFGEDGTFSLPNNAPNAACIDMLSVSARGTKGLLWKARGGEGDTVWWQTVQAGLLRWATGGTDVNEVMSLDSSGSLSVSQVISNIGQIRSAASGNAHYWLEDADGVERGVLYSEPRSNTVKLRAQRTSDSTAQSATYVFDSVGNFTAPSSLAVSNTPTNVSGVTIRGTTSGQEAGLLRGTTEGGSFTTWAGRSSGLQLDCPNSDVSAYNVWKATKWGSYHIGAMDVYSPSTANGGGHVRLVLRGNGGGENIWVWNSGAFTSPVKINAPEFYLTSDVTLKKDIRPIESTRSKLHDIEIKRYAMKDGSNDNAIGVIAQEVEQVYPELVNKGEDGKLSVNYRGLSSVLWKTVQEQDNEISEMKSRLERLEALLLK